MGTRQEGLRWLASGLGHRKCPWELPLWDVGAGESLIKKTDHVCPATVSRSTEQRGGAHGQVRSPHSPGRDPVTPTGTREALPGWDPLCRALTVGNTADR